MMWQKFREFINQQFKINLTDKHISQFKLYLKELIDCSKKFNLTSITEPEKILYLHFADSLAGNVFLCKETECKIADIGSGAGFPGLPLKIVYPEIQLTAVESTKKKALFIDHISRKLKLKKVEILNCRAEELCRKEEYLNKFDLVLFRAVSSNIQNCIDIAVKLLKKSPSPTPLPPVDRIKLSGSGKAVFWASKQSISKFDSIPPCYKVLKPHFEYILPRENKCRYIVAIKTEL
ncbi:MAG: 16S rRNA (guanine(527)-N(7))-methyltransferase RsmG [Elusimicrobiota bacterium]|nr:16S rRNA (guanine(527)-N(7))-methyltransferase RsmG [Elusimicrobiota bacterium]